MFSKQFPVKEERRKGGEREGDTESECTMCWFIKLKLGNFLSSV